MTLLRELDLQILIQEEDTLREYFFFFFYLIRLK